MDLNAADTRARLETFLRAAAVATTVSIRHLARMGGGAMQENWALDVEITGGTYAGPQQWVLRTDAAARVEASLKRSEEFEILKVAYAANVHAPRPLFLCSDMAITGREFFIMQRLPGVLTAEPPTVFMVDVAIDRGPGVLPGSTAHAVVRLLPEAKVPFGTLALEEE